MKTFSTRCRDEPIRKRPSMHASFTLTSFASESVNGVVDDAVLICSIICSIQIRDPIKY
jgi:hypothetical protein